MKHPDRDSPIDEIHRIREQISERFHGDLEAIARDAAERQAASDRPAWRPGSPGKANAGAASGQATEPPALASGEE